LNPSPAARRIFLAVAILLLLVLSWTGVSGGVRQIPQSRTLGRWTQTIAQLAYGILSLLCALTSFQGRRWRALILTCWVVSVTIAAGFAAVVWGGTSLGVGLVSGGASLLIALAIVWLLHVGIAG
jgi:hypothetical protein